MIETTTDTAVHRKRRNEIETKVSRKKRKAEKRKENPVIRRREEEEPTDNQNSVTRRPTRTQSEEIRRGPFRSKSCNIDPITFDPLSSSTVEA